MAAIFGEQDARALFALTNVLVVFGGSKDQQFNREVADLIGTVRVTRTSWQTGTMAASAAASTAAPVGHSLPISSGSASSSPGAPPSVSILRIWRRSRWMKRGNAA